MDRREKRHVGHVHAGWSHEERVGHVGEMETELMSVTKFYYIGSAD